MTETPRQWEYALDRPGSAGPLTLRRAAAMVLVIISIATVVVALGAVPLPTYPQFVTFHAAFVFLVDAITAYLLFGQFFYRRLPLYLLLGAAFLFNALVMVVFLLSFPGALQAAGGVIGASQSSIWVWHLWHILFPLLIAVALLVHRRDPNAEVPEPRLWPRLRGAIAAVVALVVLVTLSVTVFHDRLPMLIAGDRTPLTRAFYLAGGIAAATTLAAIWLALDQARRRIVLAIWLAVVLIAFLADIAASLGAYARYTVGWYFGRIESMLAASILLLVFLNEINRLYRRLATLLSTLHLANQHLAALVEEKEALVSDVQRSEEQVRKLAYYDAVTELPNRRFLLERLDYVLLQAQRYGHTVAALFLDLDKFKRINDTLGHDVGDALLHEVGVRLGHCLRKGDIAARLGGDEFVILLPEVSDKDAVVAVADKALAILAQPLDLLGHRLHISASIGIACSGSQPIDGTELLRRADVAMYRAKNAGRNRYAFSNEAE